MMPARAVSLESNEPLPLVSRYTVPASEALAADALMAVFVLCLVLPTPSVVVALTVTVPSASAETSTLLTDQVPLEATVTL